MPRGWCGHHAAPLRHHAAQPDRWPPRGCMATRVLLGASAIRAPGGLKRTRHCVACHTGPALRPGVVTDAGFAITRSSSWSPPRGSRPPDVAGGRRGAPARCPASPPGESPPPPPSSEHWPPPRAPWPLPAGFLLRGDCRVLLTGLPCPYERWLRPAYVRRAWREVEWPHGSFPFGDGAGCSDHAVRVAMRGHVRGRGAHGRQRGRQGGRGQAGGEGPRAEEARARGPGRRRCVPVPCTMHGTCPAVAARRFDMSVLVAHQAGQGARPLTEHAAIRTDTCSCRKVLS